MARAVMSVIDHSRERATHTLTTIALTAANFDAQIGLVGTYRGALENMILGEVYSQSVNILTNYDPTTPANNFAQREIKLLIRYQDTVSGKLYTLEIPTPDLANLTIPVESDFVTLADAGIMAAWVTAFENVAKAPDEPINSVNVLSAQVVGRNI